MERKWILVTGSAKGLGRAIALVFGKNNYNIVLSDIDKTNLKKTEKELQKYKVETLSVIGDLTTEKTIKNLEDISREKNLDILVNNAGLHCPYKPLQDLTDEQIDDMISINLIVPIKLTKRIYKIFIEKKCGTIVNINSLSGLKNHKIRTIYSSSKWGLRGFSESLKIEAKKYNVNILDVYPGRIKTKPEFEFGLEPEVVAQKIYDALQDTDIEKIVIDGGSI